MRMGFSRCDFFSVNRRPIDTKKLLNSLAMSVLSVIVLSLTYNDNLCADVLLILPIMVFITLHEFDKLSLWRSSWSLKYFISAFLSADLSRFFFYIVIMKSLSVVCNF